MTKDEERPLDVQQPTTKRDPREHAAAKSDINLQLQRTVKKLKEELGQIDGQIKDLEIQAAREPDADKVVGLLEERERLSKRKDALPFLLRGEQARALRRQATALREEAADVKPDLDAAELELQSATARIPELQRELEEANEALIAATRRRDELSKQYNDLSHGAGYADADAGCIERGEPMKFVPSRFIGE